ncbi:MAG: cell division protein FtsA, partial [Treponema sp.]|nr:cell division protein FtsA [Treponema sp.]
VRAEIKKNTSDSITQLSGNIILTGGGAMMEGIVELAQAKFRTSSVRIGIPDSLGGKESEYRRPDFATAIGLVQANKLIPKSNKKNSGSNKGRREKDNIFKRIRDTFF